MSEAETYKEATVQRLLTSYLGDEHEKYQDQTHPGTVYTTDGLEWKLVQGVSMILPCHAESNMGQTDLDIVRIGLNRGDNEKAPECNVHCPR